MINSNKITCLRKRFYKDKLRPMKTSISTLFILFILSLSQSQSCFSQIKREGTWVYVKNDQHQPINGFVWTKSGAFFKGQVSFVTKVSETYPKDKNGNRTTSKPVKKYYIRGYTVAGQTFKPEDVFMYGTTDQRFVKDFMRKSKNGALIPSKRAHENFHKGYIIGSDGSRSDGYVAVVAGNYVTDHVLFCETLDDPVSVFYQQPVEFHRPYNLKHIVQEIDGKTVEHFPTVTGFGMAGDMSKAEPAVITLYDGSTIEGKGSLEAKSWDYGMSFKQLLVFNDGKGLTESFSPAFGSDIQSVKLGKDEYIAFDNGFYPKEKLIKKLTKSKKKDEKNFQTGYIAFKDGSKKELRIARARKANRGFYTYNDDGVFRAYYGDSKVKYFTQNINGEEVRYRRIRDRYEVWHQPEADFSYCVNPYPTHVRKGLTKFVAGVTAAAVETVTDEIIEASARQAIKDGGNIKDVAQKAMEMDDGLTATYNPGSEGGIYFDEYLIFQKGKPGGSVVYTKNMDSYITNVVSKCDNFSSLDKKQLRKLGNIDKLDETIVFLNQNGCAD